MLCHSSIYQLWLISGHKNDATVNKIDGFAGTRNWPAFMWSALRERALPRLNKRQTKRCQTIIPETHEPWSLRLNCIENHNKKDVRNRRNGHRINYSYLWILQNCFCWRLILIWNPWPKVIEKSNNIKTKRAEINEQRIHKEMNVKWKMPVCKQRNNSGKSMPRF